MGVRGTGTHLEPNLGPIPLEDVMVDGSILLLFLPEQKNPNPFSPAMSKDGSAPSPNSKVMGSGPKVPYRCVWQGAFGSSRTNPR